MTWVAFAGMSRLILGVDDVTTATLWADAGHHHRVEVAPHVEAGLRASADDAASAAHTSPAYGRTTGVGANRNEHADDRDGLHGLRLVRSHATGAGPDLGPDVGRASMLVRAHQLCQPGSGIPYGVVVALVRALDDGRTAPVRSYGGLGTGDITVLGELALCLLGELPWHDGTRSAYLDAVDAGAALAFMSSSAPTIAAAALATERARRIGRASLVVAALSALAVRGTAQQWSAPAVDARPSAGVAHAAAVMRHVLGGCTYRPVRTQDPISFRSIPFVAGPFVEVGDALVGEIDRSIAARAENPRFALGEVWHHGAFHLTSLALHLDTFRLALTQWLSTSLARTVKVNDPTYTDQQRFLADGPAGSSGVMVLEYTAASALETVRTLADPVSRHTTTISIGTEDHASFATRAAVATHDLLGAASTIVGCELVTALRSVRRALADGEVVVGRVVDDVLARCGPLPTDTSDRPLIDDVAIAIELLPVLAELERSPRSDD